MLPGLTRPSLSSVKSGSHGMRNAEKNAAHFHMPGRCVTICHERHVVISYSACRRGPGREPRGAAVVSATGGLASTMQNPVTIATAVARSARSWAAFCRWPVQSGVPSRVKLATPRLRHCDAQGFERLPKKGWSADKGLIDFLRANGPRGR